MATDIACAVGILALFGRRVPAGNKVFLTALAIADDLLAVVVIALFYTHEIDWPFFGNATGCLVLLVAANRLGSRRMPIYLVPAARSGSLRCDRVFIRLWLALR